MFLNVWLKRKIAVDCRYLKNWISYPKLCSFLNFPFLHRLSIFFASIKLIILLFFYRCREIVPTWGGFFPHNCYWIRIGDNDILYTLLSTHYWFGLLYGNNNSYQDTYYWTRGPAVDLPSVYPPLFFLKLGFNDTKKWQSAFLRKILVLLKME